MNKIFAYLLLLAGLMMMFFACIGMYKVFIDKNPVMPVVQMADANISTQYGVVKFPMQAVNQIANLGLFSLLMIFIGTIGAKVAGVGNGLLKTERIHDAILKLKAQDVLGQEKELGKL